MNLPDISAASVASTAMLILSIFLTFIIAIAALVGFFRRWKRSLVSLCRIIVAVIIAAMIVLIVGANVNIGEALRDLVDKAYASANGKVSQTLLQFLFSLAFSALLPTAFVWIFIIVAQILRIPAYFIAKALHITKQDEIEKQNGATLVNAPPQTPPAPVDPAEPDPAATETPPATVNYGAPTFEPENKTKKFFEQFGGALISALYALIIICVLLLPTTGLICTITDGLTEFSESAKESESSLTVGNGDTREVVIDGQTIVDGNGVVNTENLGVVLKTTLGPVRNNFYVSASYSAPFKFLYNKITRVKANDTIVCFDDEIKELFEVASGAVSFVTDIENYGEKQMAAADIIADYVINSDIHREILAEVLSTIAESIDKPEDDEFVASLIEALKKTTPESVADDVITVRDIFKSAIKNNIPQVAAKVSASQEEDRYLDIIECINGDFLYDFMSAIKKNRDFSGLFSPALNYGVEAIAKSLGSNIESIDAGANLEDLSDEQIKEESEKIAASLSKLKKVITSFKDIESRQSEGLNALLEADLATLGSFIDGLQKSLLMGDGAKKILTVVLRSETLAGSELDDVFEIIAEHIEAGEKVSMEKVLVATKELAKVMNNYNSGSATEADLAASLKTIISNLDPETAAIAEEIIPKVTSQMSVGGESETSEAAEKLMTSFVSSLASDKAKEIVEDEEAFEKEVAAFDCIFDLINSIAAGNGYSIEDAEEVIDTVAKSEIASSAIVSVAYDENGNLTSDAQLVKKNITDEDRKKVAAACANYYNERKGEYSEEELSKLKSDLAAVASIFDEKTARTIANLH